MRRKPEETPKTKKGIKKAKEETEEFKKALQEFKAFSISEKHPESFFETWGPKEEEMIQYLSPSYMQMIRENQEKQFKSIFTRN